ncbi:MAG: response regulator [Desulfocapsaceae bacterium]|nr:response regulator [Desulfocapsaceae bacterium]
MKLKNMKIGTQLHLGLDLIFAGVLFLGLLAWAQNNQLWMQTGTLYDHPYKVGRAIGQLKTDAADIQREMRDILLAGSDREREIALERIEIEKADIVRQSVILNDRYLGPKKDLTDLGDAMARWHAYHDETIRRLRAGERDLALSRTRTANSEGGVTETLMAYIKTVDDFSRSKGEQLYSQATEQTDSLNRRLVMIALAILMVTFWVYLLLLRNLKAPLKQLTAAAERFRQGRLDARSGYASANEFGELSAAFDALADAVETQRLINEQAAQLAGVMLRAVDVHDFCRELIRELAGQTGSQIGAVYLLNQQKTEFVLFDSIGLDQGMRTAFSATVFEGEFGSALASGTMQRIRRIPADTRFAFATAAGSFLPREIITLPLLAGQETVAVISLAGLRGYGDNEIMLLETIQGTLTARMNGVLAFSQIQDLAMQLEQHNRELNAQRQELLAQADELTHQNTELAMQKKQLDAASRLKSTFLSNMSHELRTPLNSVIALSGVLSRRLASIIPGEEAEYLEVIERNGRNLLSLINDILDLSRIESGREELSLARFSLRGLVEEIVEMLAPLAQEKNISLLNQVDETLPVLISDPGKVRHILQNLIGNAVKFTASGMVSVSAGLADNEVRVAVRDTGIGIAADQIPRIFDEFRQADEGTARKYGGTGLGLAIARKYTTLLRGSIRVESTPGEGSVFTLVLPLVDSLPDQDRREKTEPAYDESALQAVPAGDGQCILLVEDSEPATIQLQDILNEKGYQVLVARNGREALAIIDRSQPAAVILDLMMPEMDGFEVLRQIRSGAQTFPLPVLILTAKHVSREELNFLKGNHIYQLIQKGDVGKTELLAAVARMVAPPPEKTLPRIGRKRAGSRPVVLVVEDNPDNMLTTRALLEDCQVITAENGLEALEQARLHQPDLILMDLHLPVMDGFAALAEIRKDVMLRHLQVIALTASAMNGDRESILAHGFDGYISKPIDEGHFRETLHKIIYGNA